MRIVSYISRYRVMSIILIFNLSPALHLLTESINVFVYNIIDERRGEIVTTAYSARVLVKYASTHSKRQLTLPQLSKENGLKWDFINGEFEPLPIENMVKSIGTWNALKSILLIPCTIGSKPSGYVTYNFVCIGCKCNLS